MKKRKLFKLSVIVHTMSKAAYDQNIFYTSDTDLALEFELIEKEYSYDSGEILLFNETDKSFVTRDINKVDSGFVYQIESDIIQHHGEWVGQLQLNNNSEVYTSKPFKFTIENDLSTVSPPTLTDINNWSSLKNSANELIAEMQTVISEYETAAIAYQQAENIRSVNETDRKQAESTRENHETTRQNQERVRNANEENRQTNEIERQNNEDVRLTNESERVSAESIRVSAEEQRKIDHADRSAELASKADKIVLENLVKNGDFSNGTTGWSQLSSVISNTLNEASFIANALNGRLFQFLNIQNSGQKLYQYANVKSSSNLVSLSMHGSNVSVFHSGSGQYEVLSLVHTQYSTGSLSQFQIRDRRDSGWTSVYVKNTLLINLSQIFGSGNEPTKEEMDELIKVTGYIDGEYALNNKEMLIWTLALIRRNKNAIVALGGA